MKRFKALLIRKRPDLLEGIFGRASRIVQPPLSITRSARNKVTRSLDTDNRRPTEGILAVEGVHRDIIIPGSPHNRPQGGVASGEVGASSPLYASSRSGTPTAATHASRFNDQHEESRSSSRQRNTPTHEGKGQAHDPLLDHLFLNIGSGMDIPTDSNSNGGIDDSSHQPMEGVINENEPVIVSESPGAVDINVYEKAYEEEVQKIIAARRSATLYLTRRVQDSRRLRNSYENLVDHEAVKPRRGPTGLGFAQLVASARDKTGAHDSSSAADAGHDHDGHAWLSTTTKPIGEPAAADSGEGKNEAKAKVEGQAA